MNHVIYAMVKAAGFNAIVNLNPPINMKADRAKQIEKFKELWYSRNPTHDENMATGEDMFWETALMVCEEYAKQAYKDDIIAANVAKDNKGLVHDEEYLQKKCSEKSYMNIDYKNVIGVMNVKEICRAYHEHCSSQLQIPTEEEIIIESESQYCFHGELGDVTYVDNHNHPQEFTEGAQWAISRIKQLNKIQ